MTIKDQIRIDLGKIENLRILYQVLEYLRLIRKNFEEGQGNIDEVLAFAGSIPEEDAKEISQNLESQFRKMTFGTQPFVLLMTSLF